jgi:XTP/dITP diphosphohydrolase
MPGSGEIWFATSNGHKFEEARFALRPFGIKLGRLWEKGTEIQSNDVREIARRAALEAFGRVKKPLFVEDSGLFVASLGGFPGPYASFVNRTLGPASIITLMEGVRRRNAEFISAVAFCNDPSAARVFVGRLKGEVAVTMRGSNGFGFDPIFIPTGRVRTMAEMSLKEKAEISHRSLALRALGAWLNSNLGSGQSQGDN